MEETLSLQHVVESLKLGIKELNFRFKQTFNCSLLLAFWNMSVFSCKFTGNPYRKLLFYYTGRRSAPSVVCQNKPRCLIYYTQLADTRQVPAYNRFRPMELLLVFGLDQINFDSKGVYRNHFYHIYVSHDSVSQLYS